jgi:tRNA(Ile)-lysidine synthase
LPVPSAAQLAELRRALSVRADAEAAVTWPGGEARLYRRHLYFLTPAAANANTNTDANAAVNDDAAVNANADCVAAAGRIDARHAWSGRQGRLGLVAADGYGIPNRWAEEGLSIVFRVGGERFRPRGNRHHKTLKHWFQEAGIVPWMRGDVPLLYRGAELVAVADLCLADDLPQSPDDGPFWRPVWSDHARLR